MSAAFAIPARVHPQKSLADWTAQQQRQAQDFILCAIAARPDGASMQDFMNDWVLAGFSDGEPRTRLRTAIKALRAQGLVVDVGLAPDGWSRLYDLTADVEGA
jgi:hypothetical protein